MHIPEKVKPFNCCPACGSSDIVFDDNKKFSCRDCAFTYYHNVAAAVAAILQYDERIVLIKRAKDPGKGKLDLPGGFVDPKESAEEAVIREIKEELKIDIKEPKYLGSYPNIYKCEDVLYHTCDLFFYCKIDTLPTDFNRAEIKEELKIDIKEPKYLGSYPNIYKCEDVLYHTCDLFFYCKIDALPTDFNRAEIEELVLLNPLEIPNDKIAFDSVKRSLGIFKSSKS